jgi:hypothetical protein
VSLFLLIDEEIFRIILIFRVLSEYFNICFADCQRFIFFSCTKVITLKLENQEKMPLLSVRDARLLVIAKAFATQKEVDLCLEHIRIRHRQRQADIDRYY